MRKTRTWTTAAAASLLAALLALSAAPAAASSQPDAPSNLSAVSSVLGTRDAQNQIVHTTMSYVTWDRPTDRSDITCYYVRWRVAAKNGQPAGPWQPSEQGAVVPKYFDYHDIDGLTIGETYDFEVRSYSESLGAHSDWVTLNKTATQASTDSSLKSLTLSSGTLSPAFEPEGWGDVIYTATVANSVTSITFTPTATDGDTSTISFKDSEIASGTASDAISLAVGPNYFEIVVSAEYGAYTRRYSVNVIRAGPSGRLAAPTGLTLEQDTADLKHRITLSWTLPTGATEAVLEYREVGNTASVPQWSVAGVIDLTTSGGKINTQLRDNVEYAVRVAGKNSSGTGAWATATFTAHSTPYWPLNVAAASGDASLAVSWDPPVDKGAPDAVITGYRVRWRPLPEDPCCPWSDAQSQDLGNVGSYTIADLTNNQAYEVQVRAFNNLGAGVWSETVRATPAEVMGSPLQEQTPPQQQQSQQQQQQQEPTTEDATESEPLSKPGAVSDMQVTIDGRRVTVTWSAPQQGGEPNQYVVRLKTPDKGKAKVKRVDADTTSATFGKIKAGTHTIFVRAKNEAGGGKWTKTEITVP